MGMDIFLVEYLGKDKKGYLKTRNVEKEFNWDKRRMVIRHKISDKINLIALCSGIYEDLDILYRPKNFDNADNWANSIKNKHDRMYIKRILEILKLKDNLYLEFSY